MSQWWVHAMLHVLCMLVLTSSLSLARSHAQSQAELDKKAQRHRTMQQRRFAKKATVSNPEQISMPPEMLRKIIRDHGEPEIQDTWMQVAADMYPSQAT